MSSKKIVNNFIVLLCIFCLGVPIVSASTCNELCDTVKDARNELLHAKSEDGFARAKHYARRAERSLDDATRETLRCACDRAHREFRSAASYAHRAKNAKEVQQFSIMINRSLREFDSANRALRQCVRN